MKRKRSVASYRAASLKAARTRKRMMEARLIHKIISATAHSTTSGIGIFELSRPTIDRIPKVEWRW